MGFLQNETSYKNTLRKKYVKYTATLSKKIFPDDGKVGRIMSKTFKF
jgi:hypothetical protein